MLLLALYINIIINNDIIITIIIVINIIITITIIMINDKSWGDDRGQCALGIRKLSIEQILKTSPMNAADACERTNWLPQAVCCSRNCVIHFRLRKISHEPGNSTPRNQESARVRPPEIQTLTLHIWYYLPEIQTLTYPLYFTYLTYLLLYIYDITWPPEIQTLTLHNVVRSVFIISAKPSPAHFFPA